MTYATETPHDFSMFDRGRLARRTPFRRLVGAAALTFGVSAGGWLADAAFHDVAELPARAVAARSVPDTYGALLDPASALGSAPVSLAWNAPLGSNFEPVPPLSPDPIGESENVPSPPAPTASPLAEDLPLPAPTASPLVENIPLPAPRPPEVRPWASQGPVRAPGRPMVQAARTPNPPIAPPDNRNFLEKLFGMGQPSGPALAYASPDDGVLGNARRLTSGPVPQNDRWTAIYDIAAHTVYMPSGARLEAHSGLGDRLDDPRRVSDRNRGAIPPHVYDLQPREQLFHGVQALRLNPVGAGDVYGRTGFLAHTYMLGPNGDSNGCVSFRNYNAFLQAYMNGEIKRLVVVARLS